MKHVVAAVTDFGPGEMRVVEGEKASVVVVCTSHGEYYAVRAVCPHQGAELDQGQLTDLTVGDAPGEYRIADTGAVLRCPWHSFDFDVESGRCVSDGRMRVRRYEVTVEDGKVHVEA